MLKKSDFFHLNVKSRRFALFYTFFQDVLHFLLSLKKKYPLKEENFIDKSM